MARSGYVAVTAFEDCIHCGECIDRCAFGARIFQEGKMVYDPGLCLGCGLCVTTCPTEAVSMKERRE